MAKAARTGKPGPGEVAGRPIPTGSGTGGADGQSGKDGAAGLPGSSVTDGTASNPEIAGVYDNETVKLAVSSLPPSSIGVSVPFALSVELQYGTGAVDTGFDGMVTLKLSSNPGGATLGGTLTETASDGVAVFSGLSINRAASGYAIEASTISNPSTNSTITSAPVGIDVTQTPTPTPKPTTPAINWANPAGITYGTPLSSTQLDASASVHGTFTYSRPPGTVLKAGSDTLSVTFMPTDTTDYLTVSKTVTIVVAQATPVIIWSPPAAIASGTALSSAQLDASASVPGTFSYSPAPGTVLGAGSETLSVTFTPSDSTDYKTVSATMPLTILPAPTPPPTSTPSPTPTPAPAVVISQQPVFQRKTNKKGKPVGKAALLGFTLDFGSPLDPSAATDAANYQVDSVTTRKVKKKVEHILHPITNFMVSYSAASDAVTIAFGSPETFPTGGQIAVLGGVTGGTGGPVVFAISKGGKSIAPE